MCKFHKFRVTFSVFVWESHKMRVWYLLWYTLIIIFVYIITINTTKRCCYVLLAESCVWFEIEIVLIRYNLFMWYPRNSTFPHMLARGNQMYHARAVDNSSMCRASVYGSYSIIYYEETIPGIWGNRVSTREFRETPRESDFETMRGDARRPPMFICWDCFALLTEPLCSGCRLWYDHLA